MKRTIRWVLIGTGLTVALLASFVLGAHFGIQQFSVSRALATSSYDAYWLVEALKLLRENRNERAIQFLEVALDSDIVEFGSVSERAPSRLHMIPGYWHIEKEDGNQLMRSVAQYRKDYPPANEDSIIQAYIRETLKPFE
jgi:hypothetical protein